MHIYMKLVGLYIFYKVKNDCFKLMFFRALPPCCEHLPVNCILHVTDHFELVQSSSLLLNIPFQFWEYFKLGGYLVIEILSYNLLFDNKFQYEYQMLVCRIYFNDVVTER